MYNMDSFLINEREKIIEQINSGQPVRYNEGPFQGFIPPDLVKLVNQIKHLADQYNCNYNYIKDLSRGKLDTIPPVGNSFADLYKQLQSELKHLNWQIHEISDGDYDQNVSFAGDFSNSLNKMIRSLKEKEQLFELNKRYMVELDELNKKLTLLSITDSLTNVFNRRQFDIQLEQEVSRIERFHGFFSLVMLDLDHFKLFNDTYGHIAGDTILIEVAKTVKNAIRKVDLLYRYGGEEFIIILPNTDLKQSLFLAENIRKAVEGLRIKVGEEIVNITASFGVIYSKDFRNNYSCLLEGVDKALYSAKASGRNCIRSTGDIK